MIGDNARSRQWRRWNRVEPYRIRELVAAYLVGLAIWILSLGVSIALNIPLAFVAHVFVGFFLSRFVSRRIVWNWHTSNIGDIARAKWATFIGWQLAIPILIWQLAVYKFL